MLRLIEIPLHFPTQEKLHSSMGSVMQGALMEVVGKETAARLHTMDLRPYSQCLYYHSKGKTDPRWRIGTLSDAAYEKIVMPLQKKGDSLYLRHKGYAVGLGNFIIVQETTYDAIVNHNFAVSHQPVGGELSFLTTTSFRHDGKYEIFPNTGRVFKSLISRWNSFSPVLPMGQEGAGDMLAEYCHISSYRLSSQPFSLEGKVIYGFYGKFFLRFHDNDMANRLMAALLRFAPFAGVGMKTALGMGALDTTVEYAGDKAKQE